MELHVEFCPVWSSIIGFRLENIISHLYILLATRGKITTVPTLFSENLLHNAIIYKLSSLLNAALS